MYIIDANIHKQLYQIQRKGDFIYFSLTGLISLTSSFHQPSQHLTSQQERLNLSNNVIQIIPGLNDLFV